jgi:predicted amidohydrolase
VLQLDAGTNIEENLNRALELIRAAGESCSLVALPEFFLVRGDHDTIRDRALTMQSEPIKRLAEVARTVDVNVLAGSLPFEDPDHPDRCFNRSLIFDRSGEIIARYNKIHLFDVDLDQGVTVQESDLLQSGEEETTTHVDGFHAGLSICYDLRFPALYRKYASRNVEVLFVPSNFTRETGRAHWEPLLRARAIENQAYVVAPNQIGTNPETGVASLGQSMIVDPWGQVVTRCSDREGWASAELNPGYLRRIRRELPSLDHRALGF